MDSFQHFQSIFVDINPRAEVKHYHQISVEQGTEKCVGLTWLPGNPASWVTGTPGPAVDSYCVILKEALENRKASKHSPGVSRLLMRDCFYIHHHMEDDKAWSGCGVWLAEAAEEKPVRQEGIESQGPHY